MGSKPNALILTGGHSTRMGKDKASLVYHDVPQRDYLLDICRQLTLNAYLSVNASQAQEAGINYIVDQHSDIGPMAALLAAFEFEAGPWLVLGCDYPLMGKPQIKALLEARSIKHSATAIYQKDTGYINPTIAIYEPKILPLLKDKFAAGQYSLRKLLDQAEVSKFTKNTAAFVSVDTKEAYQLIKNKIANGGAIHS